MKMKYFITFCLFSGLFLNLSSSFRGNEFYQVISSHPHDVDDISEFTDTVYQNGRLWVVQLKDDVPTEVLSHLRLLQGGEKSYMHEGMWITNKGLHKSTSKIKELVDSVIEDNIKKDVEQLASYKNRRAGSDENQAAVENVIQRFNSMGYATTKICYRAGACSVVADKLGASRPDEVLLVEGHIDSVGAAFAGADDNASGTAVILEMARVLKDYKNQRTIRFFVTNGEELGLLGANHYAELLAKNNQIKNLALVINMDMVGYNENGIVELETDPEYEDLAKWFADLASKYTKLQTKITLGAWGSDHVPFLKKGVPSLLTIEDWDTKTPCYHQACDRPDTLNYEYASEIAKLNLSAVLNKDI